MTNLVSTATTNWFALSPDAQFWMNWLVAFLTAVGTVGAVIVVLSDKLFSPKLRLTLLSPVGELCPVTRQWKTPEGIATDVTMGRFYHLNVSNERGWRVANNVQVYLLQVEERGPDDHFRIVWSNEVPIKWRNQEVFSLTQTIGPPKDCDLCTVFENGGLVLQPIITPYNLPSNKPGKQARIFTFQARAIEGVSPIAKIRVAWDGKWDNDDDEMQKHLTIEDITEVKSMTVNRQPLLSVTDSR